MTASSTEGSIPTPPPVPVLPFGNERAAGLSRTELLGRTTLTTVTYLGHASLLFESGGDTIVTDPVFSDRIARYFTKRTYPAEVRPEDFQGVVAVLVSHAHHDHLDYPSLARVGPSHPVVVPWGLSTTLRWRGFTEVRVLRPWEGLAFGKWTVTAVPSRHFGGRLPLVYTSGHQGYVLSGPSCIYFAGDTGFNESMFREIGRRFRLDLAVLPIAGAVFPWFRRNHMNAVDALLAFRTLGAKQMLPMHFETFHASFEPAGAPRRRLLEEARRLHLGARVTVLSQGASLRLESAEMRSLVRPRIRADGAATTAPPDPWD